MLFKRAFHQLLTGFKVARDRFHIVAILRHALFSGFDFFLLFAQEHALCRHAQLVDHHAKRDNQPHANDARDRSGNAALQFGTNLDEPDMPVRPHEELTINEPSSQPVFPTGEPGHL